MASKLFYQLAAILTEVKAGRLTTSKASPWLTARKERCSTVADAADKIHQYTTVPDRYTTVPDEYTTVPDKHKQLS